MIASRYFTKSFFLILIVLLLLLQFLDIHSTFMFLSLEMGVEGNPAVNLILSGFGFATGIYVLLFLKVLLVVLTYISFYILVKIDSMCSKTRNSIFFLLIICAFIYTVVVVNNYLLIILPAVNTNLIN